MEVIWFWWRFRARIWPTVVGRSTGQSLVSRRRKRERERGIELADLGFGSMGNEGAFGCIGLHGAVEELRQNGVTGIGHQNDGEEEIRSNLIFYYFCSSLFLFVLIIFHFFYV